MSSLMIENPQDHEVGGSLYEKLAALVIALFISALSGLATLFAVVVFSSTRLAYRRFGDEGSSWLGIGVGIPLSFVVAVVIFVIALRWRLKTT
jgi:hypothetical protein